MSIIDSLKKLKEFICGEVVNEEQIAYKINDRNKIFRLHYLYFNDYSITEIHDFCCDTFEIPNNWNNDDAFKVISYFFDHTSFEIGSYQCCHEATLMLSDFGFKILKDNLNNYQIIDLFSVVTNDCYYMFKRNKYYKKYFEWYHEGITNEDVINICNKYNYEIPNMNSKKISLTK